MHTCRNANCMRGYSPDQEHAVNTNKLTRHTTCPHEASCIIYTSIQLVCYSIQAARRARVSPVQLVGCVPTGYITVAWASCPLAAEQLGRVLLATAGTFCLSARGLSPGVSYMLQCPLCARGVKSSATVHRGSPPRCTLT
eukprot:364930-Chlamydomonas_euryale.AAC.22